METKPLICPFCRQERPDDDARCPHCERPRFRHKTRDAEEFWEHQRLLDEMGR